MQSRLGTTIGAVAQVVEQWTENPCVAGSTPASTTLGPLFFSGLFCFYFWDTAHKVRPGFPVRNDLGGIPGPAFAMASSSGSLINSLPAMPFPFLALWHSVPEMVVPRTEDASGAAVGCPQSGESAVLRAFEDASRTTGACFWHRISLPYRKRLFLSFPEKS